MFFTEQVTHGWLFLTEIHLAGRRNIEPHLVLNIGDVSTISLAKCTGIEIKHKFRN